MTSASNKGVDKQAKTDQMPVGQKQLEAHRNSFSIVLDEKPAAENKQKPSFAAVCESRCEQVQAVQ